MEAYKELMSALEAEEITQNDFNLAKSIEFNINQEDITLFVQGMQSHLGVIKSVSYSDIEGKYDGAYEVVMTDGTIKYYGWYDLDSCVTLYPI